MAVYVPLQPSWQTPPPEAEEEAPAIEEEEYDEGELTVTETALQVAMHSVQVAFERCPPLFPLLPRAGARTHECTRCAGMHS